MESAHIDTRLEELLGHENWLRRFAASLVNSEAAADDLVQETWLAAIRRPPSSDRPTRPWLARVVRNLARMGHRSDTRRKRREALADADVHTNATTRTGDPTERADTRSAATDELLARLQHQRMLADVVVELEEPYRTVILLHYFEGLSAAEIARREHIPPSTVRSRHQLGLEKLRRALDRRHGGNRQAWCLALQPLIAWEPVAASSSGVLSGILAMKTIYKLAIAAIALIALLVGANALFGTRSDVTADTPTPVDTPASRPRAPSRLTAPISPDVHEIAAYRDPGSSTRLEGQVVDAHMRPVVDAVVTVSTNPERIAVSESDGSFYFDHLLPRRYNLVARAGQQRAGPIGVRLTGESEPVILQVESGATFEVQVVGETAQQPIAGATVHVRGWLNDRHVTDDDGRATFQGLPFGRYTVATWAPGYGKRHTVFVATEGNLSERVTLSAGASVSGRVTEPDGRPVAGARVVYRSMASNLQDGDWAHDTVETDTDGQFRFPALPRGTYRLAARSSGFATGFSEPVSLDGVNRAESVDIELRPGAVITGQVVDADGKPAPFASVSVAAFEAQSPSIWTLITDPSGQFTVTDLPRSTVELVAYNEIATSAYQTIDLRDPTQATGVSIALSQQGFIAGVVVDADGRALEGMAVRAYPQSSTPPKRGSDLRWMLERRHQELTDAAGRFQIAGLPAGAFALRANPPSVSARGLDWMRETTPAAVGDTDVRIVVQSEGGIRGQLVIADDGSIPELFTVGLWGTRLDIRPYANRDGAFEIRHVPPGEYAPRFRGMGFEPRQIRGVRVRPGEVTDIGTVEVHRGRVVSGQVTSEDGQPVPGAEVMAGRLLVGSGLDADMGRFGPSFAAGTKRTMTDENGRFTLHSVARGRISIIAAHAEHGRSAPVEIAAERAAGAQLQLALTAYGALEGVVLEAGKPAKGVQVIARSMRDPATVLMVGTSDGRFRFDRVAPDEYSVQAMPSTMLAGMVFHTKSASVSARATTQVTLEMVSGAGSVEVRPVRADGSLVNSMIFHMRGSMTATTAWELFEATGRGGGGTWSLAFSSDRSPAYLSGLSAGPNSVCAVAFPTHVQGMDAMFDVLLSHSTALSASCRSVDIRNEDGEHTIDIPVTIPDLPSEPFDLQK